MQIRRAILLLTSVVPVVQTVGIIQNTEKNKNITNTKQNYSVPGISNYQLERAALSRVTHVLGVCGVRLLSADVIVAAVLCYYDDACVVPHLDWLEQNKQPARQTPPFQIFGVCCRTT